MFFVIIFSIILLDLHICANKFVSVFTLYSNTAQTVRATETRKGVAHHSVSNTMANFGYFCPNVVKLIPVLSALPKLPNVFFVWNCTGGPLFIQISLVQISLLHYFLKHSINICIMWILGYLFHYRYSLGKNSQKIALMNEIAPNLPKASGSK